MESEFDKVIDALMRSSPLNGGAANRVSADHLDADEIAAFAENLIPAAARQTYVLHFADCGRCRSILSDVITLNADAANASAPITATAAAPVIEAVTPWYRRLFAMPNLAYGMGGLIVVFSGLIGYTVLNNMSGNTSMVSQTSDRAMPAYQTANANAAAASASAANAANTASDHQFEEQQPSANSAANATARREYGFEPTQTPSTGTYTQRLKENTDRAAENQALPPPPPAPPAPMTEAKPMKDGEAKSVAEPESADVVAEAAPSATKQSPMLGRSNDAAKRKIENSPRLSSAAPGSGSKRYVGGKSFEQRSGVWYDLNYNGQSTTNVRRGTQEFRNLDSGLRSIADNLRGSIVVIWKSKAYRID